jgi:hypothetical protein
MLRQYLRARILAACYIGQQGGSNARNWPGLSFEVENFARTVLFDQNRLTRK